MKTLYAYDDNKSWGKQFVMAAARAGINAHLFTDINQIPPATENIIPRVFCRLDQTGKIREQSKEMITELNRRGYITLPDAIDAEIYDDKLKQHQYLNRWMPRTVILKQRKAIEKLIESESFKYPFISKSSDCSASKGVRLIQTKKQAQADYMQCFSPKGRETDYGRTQKDYIYWQEFFKGNDFDLRFVICGHYMFGLKRFNRPDKPFASGSGKFEPLDLNALYNIGKTIRKTPFGEAAEMCEKAAKHIRSDWICFDVVFNHDDPGEFKPYILECSAAWTPSAYKDCKAWVIDERGGEIYFHTSTLRGAHMFDMAVQILERK